VNATGPHMLVIAVDPSDSEHLLVSVECPGVTAACRAWQECPDCAPDHARRVKAWNESPDGTLHGVDHVVAQGLLMTPTGQCLVATHDELHDAGVDVTRVPGRYPVDVEFVDDGEEVVLRPCPAAGG
jgi:hypothetical protein